MVEAVGAVMKVAPELLVENLACVSSMVVAKGVRRRTVPKVQKVILDSALPMVVEGGASFQTAQRVLKEAQSSARHMVEENAAHSSDAPEGLKVALHFVRAMVEASAAPFRVVVCAQRVCMVALSFVLPMVVGKDVLAMAALRALEVVQSIVCAMEVARGASLKAAPRVHRGALISVRPMGEVNDVHGARQTQALVLVHSNAIDLFGARLIYAQLTAL